MLAIVSDLHLSDGATSMLLGSSLTTVVVGMAATLLALALLVQVLQEMWKYLFKTRASVYSRVLTDFLGPVAQRMMEPGVLPEFTARGPFQFLRLRPEGMLLPLGKDDLVVCLERVSTPWYRRALRALRAEVDVQQGTPRSASPVWLGFMRELVGAAEGGPGAQSRLDLIGCFRELGADAAKPPDPFDAARALQVFRERFMPHVLDAQRRFGRLGELFDYQYKRRNTALTFAFGAVIAFLLGFPAQEVYRRAAAMSPEQAMALATSAQALYRQMAETTTTTARLPAAGARPAATPPANDTTMRRLQGQLDTLLVLLNRRATSQTGGLDSLSVGYAKFRAIPDWKGRFLYAFGCLVTALLISFGAPFWNDLLGALSMKNRPAPAPRADGPATTEVAHA